MSYDTTALFAFIDAMLTAFRADATLTANSVQILDGPRTTDLSAMNILTVGGDLGDETDGATGTPTGRFVQRFDLMGSGGAKDEQLEVTCHLLCRSGDTDMSTVRSTLSTLLAAIETILRNPLNMGVGRIRYVSLASGDLVQLQANTGAWAGLTFTVTASVRLF